MTLIRSYGEFIDGLRARKVALGMSDLVVDEVAGLAHGHFGKIVTHLRGIGASTLFPVLNALGLSVVLVEDADKLTARGDVERRIEHHVRRERPLMSKELAARIARPAVLQQLARKAAKAKWKRATPEQRQAHVAMMNIARAAQRERRLARKRKAA
jgi:hypothetical protein